jgi:hypothetical protein
MIAPPTLDAWRVAAAASLASSQRRRRRARRRRLAGNVALGLLALALLAGVLAWRLT